MKKPLQIILVEDNPQDALLLRAALIHVGSCAVVHHVQDVDQGLRWFDKGANPKEGDVPYLLLLDLNLPRKHGTRLLSEVQKNRTNHVPILVWTSSQNEADVAECARLGADQYALKPATWDQFIEFAQYLEGISLPQISAPPVWLDPLQAPAETPPSDSAGMWVHPLTSTLAALKRASELLENVVPSLSNWEPPIRACLNLNRALRDFWTYIQDANGHSSSLNELEINMPQLSPTVSSMRTAVSELQNLSMDIARELQKTTGQGTPPDSGVLERLSLLRKETAKLFQLEKMLLMEQFRDVPALD